MTQIKPACQNDNLENKINGKSYIFYIYIFLDCIEQDY
jgi:hypothetical protein